ncbi:MAG TPA: hypothetical protein PLZ33_06340, partial [Smithellaceae bacterium]|jgi:hypothetical protein|nr:hypothetical protein [Smithellaceae bacterium]HPV72562.1 hypothetical protein [Smithellaceae bacterium]HQN67336.1 hypothetical protein [Smithellaceae bacterium]
MLSRAHADIHVNLVEEAQPLADRSETAVLLEEGVRQFEDLFCARPAAASVDLVNSLFDELVKSNPHRHPGESRGP